MSGGGSATAIEATGDERDLDGLVTSVWIRYGVLPTNVPEGLIERSPGGAPLSIADAEITSVRYEDETDALHHAFARGLAAYVRGFVDSKVDGTLTILEDREGDEE